MWAEHEPLLRATEVQYLKHLYALRALDQLRRQPARSREPDLSQPPPYPIDVIDGLWEQVRTKEQEIGQFRVDDDLLDKLTEERSDALKATSRAPWQEAEARRHSGAAGTGDALAALEEEFDSREVESEVAASNVKLLRLLELELGNSVSRRMWEQCYGLGQAGNPAASAKWTDEAQLMLARVRQFRTYMLGGLDHLHRRLEAEEHRKAGLAGNARRHAERRVRAFRDGEAVLRREAASGADRLRLLYAELGALTGGLWNFELARVEDRIVDQQPDPAGGVADQGRRHRRSGRCAGHGSPRSVAAASMWGASTASTC